ncbi:AraC family transcriptional regulator [Paludisphaera soli]|uniref:AraC family transcriptional regulator n=1 Tax=Paludisphaera soli TaxID=2712865 RepID=UPI0013EAA401|nr:xylose operon transcription regulator XylR [Paludisphaera soli]
MAETPRVALLVETSRGFGRDLLRGIIRYARLHGPWGCYVTPGDFEQMLPRMKDWGGTGIIARVETPRVARAILRSGLPTIVLDLSDEQLRPENPLSRLSEVASDSRAAARMAAEHLLDRGFRNLAYVGVTGRVWSRRRREAFCARVREAGLEPLVYSPPAPRGGRSSGGEQTALARWLRALPRPAGIMACNDDRGREVLEACRDAGLHVPEELAVIGVDDDELLCELADPPLSSVALNAEPGGYRVAALLDAMMRGRVRRPRRLLVEPLHVVTRRSSDIEAQGDPEVAAALHFIHDRAAEPIGVADVVDDLMISRRALEIRFRKSVGRTIHAEIQRVRLERVLRLLHETDLPIPQVAEASGFTSASYLSQVFREALGTTPARYRRRMRSDPTDGRS